jgi:LytS/YehU family sensor histidine kinase
MLSQSEVKALYEAPNPKRLNIILRWGFIAGGFLALLAAIYLLVRYQLNRKHQAEKKRLETSNKMLETELRVIRASMSPHFIFNSLNAIQGFILKNENATANNYLVRFSRLMRNILDSNASDLISLELEMELLKGYLEIEGLRFKENIRYSISATPPLVASSAHIPIMMLQPFVENAIWHGLLKKEGEKILNIRFDLYHTKYVRCTIDDNGIGRKSTAGNSPQKASLATALIMQRLELLNRIHNLACSLEIKDKPYQGGTLVVIVLPILKPHYSNAPESHHY